MEKDSLSSTPVPAFIACRHFDDGHSDWYELVSHCVFDLHFSNDEQCWASFQVFVYCSDFSKITGHCLWIHTPAWTTNIHWQRKVMLWTSAAWQLLLQSHLVQPMYSQLEFTLKTQPTLWEVWGYRRHFSGDASKREEHKGNRNLPPIDTDHLALPSKGFKPLAVLLPGKNGISLCVWAHRKHSLKIPKWTWVTRVVEKNDQDSETLIKTLRLLSESGSNSNPDSKTY